MRKYVATNAHGQTANGHKLKPGKFIQNSVDKKDLIGRVGNCCCDSPLLAVLASPFSAEQGKLFSINCWNVAVDPSSAQSYTVVKEVTPIPTASLEQKLDFAVAFCSRIYKNKEFRQWASHWLANEDRTSLSAKEVRQTIQKEIQATSDLEALTAWGETGGSDGHIIHEIDDLVQRAQHVVTAVELFASASPDRDKATREIAQALAGLDKFAKVIDLVVLAEEVCQNTSVDQASSVDRAIAS